MTQEVTCTVLNCSWLNLSHYVIHFLRSETRKSRFAVSLPSKRAPSGRIHLARRHVLENFSQYIYSNSIICMLTDRIVSFIQEFIWMWGGNSSTVGFQSITRQHAPIHWLISVAPNNMFLEGGKNPKNLGGTCRNKLQNNHSRFEGPSCDSAPFP